MLFEFFLWLDRGFAQYWAFQWGAFALCLAAALLPWRRDRWWGRWNHPVLFAALALLLIIAHRWTCIGGTQEYNPDESQMLAAAITMARHHALWSIDLGNTGPLAALPLTLPALVGLPIDYTTGRGVALLMNWGVLLCFWGLLRHLFSDWLARVLALPLLCVLAFNRFEEFVQYSSEQGPLFCFAAALFLSVTAFDAAGSVISRARLFGAGLLLGLLPFAKLQAAPLGAVLGLFALVAILRQPERSWAQRGREAGWLVGGTLLAIGGSLAAIAASGSLHDFAVSYLQMSLIYAGNRTFGWNQLGAELWSLAITAWGFTAFLWPTWVLAGLALPCWGLVRGAARRLLVLAGLLLVCGYYVTGAPGRQFPHYLQFLILPSVFFLAVLYGGLVTRPAWPWWARLGWLIPWLALGVWPQFDFFFSAKSTGYLGTLRESRDHAVGPLAQLIVPRIQPGDTLAVWGWACGYHVQTQLPQAAPEAHTERLISANPLREFYRARYLAALQRDRPAFFIDAVGEGQFGFKNRAVDGHESLPALGAFVAEHYVQVGDLENARLYVRRDRIPAAGP